MILTSIVLRQFRNHALLELPVDPGVNLFVGSNGAGKTNVMEAIAVLATGVSPRGAEPETMVQWGTDGFAVKGEFVRGDAGSDALTLEMKYRPGGSRIVRQNGQEAVRLRDLLGRVPLVSFVPEDLSLVKGEPELRRRALNMILIQLDPSYAETLKTYTDALKSRNAALRQLSDGFISEDALEPWNIAVVDAGLKLCEMRSQFLQGFSPRVSAVQERMSEGREQLRLEYRPSFAGPWTGAEDKRRWLSEMERLREQEKAMGATVIGPHRDDISFVMNGRPARSFASEGQKRTMAVAFKLAEIPTLQEKLGQKPICLLDDVLSELDARRAELLLSELVRTGQCFVTMTGLESWPRGCELPGAVYRVNESGVNRETMEAAF